MEYGIPYALSSFYTKAHMTMQAWNGVLYLKKHAVKSFTIFWYCIFHRPCFFSSTGIEDLFIAGGYATRANRKFLQQWG
jgi:hypothetical protein